MLAINQRKRALQADKISFKVAGSRHSTIKLVVKFPHKAFINRINGMPSDVVDQELVLAGLRRLQPKPRAGDVQIRIDLRFGPTLRPFRAFIIGMLHPRVQQDQTLEPLLKPRECPNRHETTKTVRHNNCVGA